MAEFKRTEYGNAERLVARHGAELRYCHPWRRWLVWDGTRWAPDDSGEVDRRAKDTVRAMYAEVTELENTSERRALGEWAVKSETRAAVNAMVGLAASEPGVPVLPDELDAQPWALNVRNGTINLRTGELHPHDQGQLITKLPRWTTSRAPRHHCGRSSLTASWPATWSCCRSSRRRPGTR